jgi:hypothetical protein
MSLMAFSTRSTTLCNHCGYNARYGQPKMFAFSQRNQGGTYV